MVLGDTSAGGSQGSTFEALASQHPTAGGGGGGRGGGCEGTAEKLESFCRGEEGGDGDGGFRFGDEVVIGGAGGGGACGRKTESAMAPPSVDSPGVEAEECDDGDGVGEDAESEDRYEGALRVELSDPHFSMTAAGKALLEAVPMAPPGFSFSADETRGE